MTDEKMLELVKQAGAFVDIDGFPPKRWADMSEDHLREFAALAQIKEHPHA